MRRRIVIILSLLLLLLPGGPLRAAADEPYAGPAAVVLLIDGSGSMAFNDPERIRVEAARKVAYTLNDGDYLAAVEFSSEIRELVPMRRVGGAEGRREIAARIARAGQRGDTDTLGGLRTAFHQFDGAPAGARQFVILLSDGESDVPGVTNVPAGRKRYFADTETLLGRYREEGRAVHCIAFREEGAELADIAAKTGGEYHFVTAADDLKNIFADILLTAGHPPGPPEIPAAPAAGDDRPAGGTPAVDAWSTIGKDRFLSVSGPGAVFLTGAAVRVYPGILYALPILLLLLVLVRVHRRDRVKGKLRVWVNTGAEVRFAKYSFRLGSAGKREIRIGTVKNRETDFTLAPLDREFSFLIRAVQDPYEDRNNGRLRRLLFGPKMLYEVVCLPGTVMQMGEGLKTRDFLYDEDGFEIGGYVFALQSSAVEKRPRGEDVLESHRPADGPRMAGKKILTLRVVGRGDG